MAQSTLIDSYREYYFSTFLPAYADLTGYTLMKHKEILYSIDSANSHLMKYLSPELEPNIQDENIKKAMTHLERATLDCYKLLWMHFEKDLKSLISDSEKRVLCVNMSESDLLDRYHKAEFAIVDSRRFELQNVGLDLKDTIEKYKNAFQLVKTILENVDPKALEMFDKKRKHNKWRDIGIAFIIGLIAGIIASIIAVPIIRFLFP